MESGLSRTRDGLWRRRLDSCTLATFAQESPPLLRIATLSLLMPRCDGFAGRSVTGRQVPRGDKGDKSDGIRRLCVEGRAKVKILLVKVCKSDDSGCLKDRSKINPDLRRFMGF